MRLRDLEGALQDVAAFENPVAALEQYPTSPHLASRMLHTAAFYEDVTDCSVLDLGCGGGILGIAAASLGASHVLGVDIDESALAISSQNCEQSEVNDICDFARADVTSLAGTSGEGVLGRFDTVVMNPPFGTKRRGMDICFLQVGVMHASRAVYSLHKSSTRDFVRKKAIEWNTVPEVVAQMRFHIPAMYAFHRQYSVDVEVDLWRLDCAERIAAPLPDPRSYVAEAVSLPSNGRGRRRGGSRRGGRSRRGR